jgi:hypothetical protein
MKTKRIALIAVMAAAGLNLAACGGHKDEAAEQANMAPADFGNEAEPTNITEVPTEAPQATQVDNTASNAIPAAPAPTVSATEQTQDDADATGMTARVSRDETGGNEAGDVAK